MSSPKLNETNMKFSKEVASLATRLRAAAKTPESVSDESLQLLLAAAVKLYSSKNPDGIRLRAFPEGGAGVTATDVMVATTAMLHAVNVQMFELGMWQAFSGAYALHRGEKVT
jgi:O-acetyl-ADP-ribose deacetylase (regulator of RNase III)